MVLLSVGKSNQNLMATQTFTIFLTTNICGFCERSSDKAGCPRGSPLLLSPPLFRGGREGSPRGTLLVPNTLVTLGTFFLFSIPNMLTAKVLRLIVFVDDGV